MAMNRRGSNLPQHVRQRVEQEVKQIIDEAKQAAAIILNTASRQAETFLEREKKKAQREATGIIEEAQKEASELVTKTPVDAPAHHYEDYPLHTEKSDTLVVHCSDPRFQEAFQLFVHEELGLETYDPLVVPGATQLLTFADRLPKFAAAIARPLRFLIKGHGLERVVIIMHEDCAWYKDFVPQFVRVKSLFKDQQVQDMLIAKRVIQDEFPHIAVEMFYAAIVQEGRVRFSEVTEAAAHQKR